MSMEEKDKIQAILGRDYFNFYVSPLREKYQEIKRVQDVMNRDINKIIYEEPEPPEPPPWEPEKPSLETKLKFLEFDFLGLYVDDYLPTAWNDLERARKELYALLKRATDEMYGDYPGGWSGFVMLSSGDKEHAHCNKKLPWVIKNGKVDWFEFEPKWWEIYDAFIDMLRLFKIEPKPQAFMRGKYNKFPYKNNVNGFTDHWQPEAMNAQIHFIRELLKRGKYIKFINEPTLRAVFPGDNKASVHGGDHILANWHRDVFLAVQDMTDLRHLILDNSQRENVVAQLIEFSRGERTCSKCGIEWDNPDGSNRKGKHEKHGVTCFESLEGGTRNWFSLSKFIISAWHEVKTSEDGGYYPEAKGFRLFDFDVSFGSAAQIEKMLDYAWTTCSTANRRKEMYWGIWPAEVFVKTEYGIRQIYNPDVINWQRFRVSRNVHRRIFG